MQEPLFGRFCIGDSFLGGESLHIREQGSM